MVDSRIYHFMNRSLGEHRFSKEDALELSVTEDLSGLMSAANNLRRKFKGDEFDLCSIYNAKSGLCSENCSFCAQSAHHQTGIDICDLADPANILSRAREIERAGIGRFSLVTSGRGIGRKDLDGIIETVRLLKKETSLSLCASLGIIEEASARELHNAGLSTYHHNLETGESYFPMMCTTHSYRERVQTIVNARAGGLGVCSGGIIGLGESMEDRIEMALHLKELEIRSVPLNILIPIKGTPLENRPTLSVEEILRTIALFRFILPDAFIRYAGGKDVMGDRQTEGLRCGINGALLGNYLTTAGRGMSEDLAMIAEAGFRIPASCS